MGIAEQNGLRLENACYAIPQSRHGGRREILRDASLAVQPGERVGVVGPNGAGKSTLLKVLAGLLRLDSGELTNDGFRANSRRRRFQRSVHLVAGAPLGCYPRLTGAENLRFFAALWGHEISAGEAQRRLEAVGLGRDSISSAYSTYSLGMRQRVHLALLLVDEAATTWLLDEPTTGLDEQGTALLGELLAQGGERPQVLVSHDLGFLENSCTRIVRLEHGSLVG